MDIYFFGELLAALRKQHHINQNDLAQKLDVHRNTIGRWERGMGLPESKTIVLELAKQLHLNENETRQLLEASLTAVSPYWLMPYQRNPFFTGRESVLQQLHTTLTHDHSVALSQSYALSGLGGIGKTQTAIEYAYRYANEYSAVFWVGAETNGSIVSSFVAIADLLNLPEKQEKEHSRIMSAVTRWFTSHSDWLAIFDNVEDLELVRSVLPPARCGSLLFTTRRQALGFIAQTLDLEAMAPEEGMRFLLHRARLLDPMASLDQLASEDLALARKIVAEMDGLPLALDQAGAYIEEMGCHIGTYLELYRTHRKKLLHRRGHTSTDHPEPVATTWSLSFEKIKRSNPAAAELLRLCAFLEPDAIPEELISEGSTQLGPILGPVASDSLQFNEAIQELRKFSLIQRNPEGRLLRLHRLVQAVLKDTMETAEQSQWVERAIRATNAVFPETVEMTTWPLCRRYLAQAQACTLSIQRAPFALMEAAALFYRTACYLRDYALYEQAEPLYHRAACIQEQALGPGHPDVATSLNGLAILYKLQGKYEQAESLYQRAAGIREQALGPDHPDVATSLNGLAIIYWKQGKYEQAEPLFLQSMRIWEQALGPGHPDVATSLNGLALLYWKQGKYEQAEPLLLRALHIWKQVLGSGHLYVAGGFQNLALLYYEQGKYEQAESLYQQAKCIWEQVLGPDHPDLGRVLNNLGELYYEQGKYEQAEPLFQQALRINEQSLGPDHPEVAYPLNGLANIYHVQGKHEQAESLFQRALYIRECHLEPQHPDIAETLHDFAVFQEAHGKRQEAASLYQRVLAIREQVLGVQHPKTCSTREHLHTVSQAIGRTEETAMLDANQLEPAKLKDEQTIY